MKVEVLTTFQHNGLFHEGEVRVVDEVLGDYFLRAGWVKDLSESPKPTAIPSSTDVILEVQDVAQSNEIQNSGV